MCQDLLASRTANPHDDQQSSTGQSIFYHRAIGPQLQAPKEIMKTANRWTIAIAGIFLQIALGAVYAWSVFRVPLSKQFGWSISQVTLTFTISIFVLGFAAFFGGLWMNRKGPRIVALTGGVLYGLGVFLASFSANKLWWLYLSYGFIGGLG